MTTARPFLSESSVSCYCVVARGAVFIVTLALANFLCHSKVANSTNTHVVYHHVLKLHISMYITRHLMHIAKTLHHLPVHSTSLILW